MSPVLPDAATVVDLLHGLIEGMESWAPPAAVTRIAWGQVGQTLTVTVVDRDAAEALAHAMRLPAALTAAGGRCWRGTWQDLDVTITPGSAR